MAEALEGLIERLREPDFHDPACPFKNHCHCGEDGSPPPHDRVSDPLKLESADALESALRLLGEVEKALEPFAAYARVLDAVKTDVPDNHRQAMVWSDGDDGAEADVTAGDFRQARSALDKLRKGMGR